MPKNYWMVVQTPENFEISKELGFTLHGLRSRHRRRAQRMEPDDLVLYYVSGIRKWTGVATIASRYFESREPVWKSVGRRGEDFPYRVKLSPSIVLDEEDYIDALALGPRLEYVKRWAPERWPLAFTDSLHLLPQTDFRLIEGEMKKALSRKRKERRRARTEGDGGDDGAEKRDQSENEVEEQQPYSAAEGSAAGSR